MHNYSKYGTGGVSAWATQQVARHGESAGPSAGDYYSQRMFSLQTFGGERAIEIFERVAILCLGRNARQTENRIARKFLPAPTYSGAGIHS